MKTLYIDFSCNNIISKAHIMLFKDDEVLKDEVIHGLDHAFEALPCYDDDFDEIYLNDEKISFTDFEQLYDDFMEEE